MNHSQQLEPSLGKRTELICTPNSLNINIYFQLQNINLKKFEKIYIKYILNIY